MIASRLAGCPEARGRANRAWRRPPRRGGPTGKHVDKYGTGGDTRQLTASGAHSINGTKSTRSLSGDLFGDWREEVILPRDDNAALRVYATTTQTDRRIHTLMHDAQYRVAIAWQNTRAGWSLILT